MRGCSITKKLQIVRGGVEDYKRLAHFHYCDNNTTRPYAAIFAIRPTCRSGVWAGVKTVGVIVYAMPSLSVEMRNVATNNFFIGFDGATQLKLINENVRCISRVIIEPRFRCLGLAGRLVRETLPEMGVPIVEAMAVMGAVNPFFERAGMTGYEVKVPVRCVQLIEAFSMVGIESEELVDFEKVRDKLGRLGWKEKDFIEQQIKDFLEAYGKRRHMGPGVERTRYVLSRLVSRPIYYIWFNSKKAFSG